jgi:hypothetical protein
MTSATEVNMGLVMGVTRLGQGAILAGASLFKDVNVSTVLIVAGVIIWAIATWRKDTREVLRRQNEDLATRNKTLEDEKKADAARILALEGRPNVDKLYESDLEIIASLKELTTTIKANTAAVQLWATARAQEIA